MKILKASAGSGKTYRLAKTYLSLLTSSSREDAYRHILAVTFTNKATSEMKARILSELYSLSKTSRQAEKLLHSLLHDYSAFSVSTIDRFFQQVLKSFSREIGQMADYQIELDRGSVIKEAMDRILESLTSDDRQLLDWIRAGVQNSLQSGTRLRIEDKVTADSLDSLHIALQITRISLKVLIGTKLYRIDKDGDNRAVVL